MQYTAWKNLLQEAEAILAMQAAAEQGPRVPKPLINMINHIPRLVIHVIDGILVARSAAVCIATVASTSFSWVFRSV